MLRTRYGREILTVLKNQVVITDNAEHPEMICRWWDNFFELDNSVMFQNGVLDEVLFKQEDGSYTKIDGFAILPVMSYSMALTTFTGQNMGAKKYDR